MKIFISWSGDKSKKIAIYLKTWIEQIIQATEPWISVDIDKGKRWNSEIISKLEESKVGIICITRNNLNSPWILFEAGALSKTSDSYVCTFLIDLSPTDLTGPLSIFQATRFNKEDIFKLLSSINSKIHDSGLKELSPETLKSLFTVFYPQLEKNITDILKSNDEKKEKEIRTERELLEEAVQLLRKLGTPQNANNIEKEAKELLDFYAVKFAKSKDFMTKDDKWKVGTEDYIDEFMSYIHENPLLLKVFNGVIGLRSYVKIYYDGLPF